MLNGFYSILQWFSIGNTINQVPKLPEKGHPMISNKYYTTRLLILIIYLMKLLKKLVLMTSSIKVMKKRPIKEDWSSDSLKARKIWAKSFDVLNSSVRSLLKRKALI